LQVLRLDQLLALAQVPGVPVEVEALVLELERVRR
jgi:hypothetical protein